MIAFLNRVQFTSIRFIYRTVIDFVGKYIDERGQVLVLQKNRVLGF